MTEVHFWLWLDDAPPHVQEAAAVTALEPIYTQVRIYRGANKELYAFWHDGDEGMPATRWVRLPDAPV